MMTKEVDSNKTNNKVNKANETDKNLTNKSNVEQSSKDVEVMLTTIDNPFDPFDDFASWFMFDNEKNYFTSSKLARIIKITEGMSEKEEKMEIERAIDRLIELDPLDIYIKVTHHN